MNYYITVKREKESMTSNSVFTIATNIDTVKRIKFDNTFGTDIEKILTSLTLENSIDFLNELDLEFIDLKVRQESYFLYQKNINI